ncbi:HAMP domain-containing sensor histidine kinase [Negativibacillus massiliensis]|uniref:sensor histidine kinase n=1 Tax=Negativibacillus massiliensis TaxID=1871035 RepID=UPI002A8357C1|nr:HAMP domain-containing sensor histidine kinase [Negativibacillus massiliensis]MDY4047892.1 HAMP domain-containing sensor histidine kinase [Negativibacillus massiliensis]
MRILANRKTKHLFWQIALLIAGFSSISIVSVSLQWEYSVWCVLVSAILMGVFIVAALYLYFRKQDQIIENAVTQIREYLSGNQDARIDCDEEGELYRLFHEVNSLAAILNAHAENEGRAKYFLKDTISNISHQLKTPLAALNIYNGLLQEESKDFPEIKEFTDLSEQELDRMEALVQNLLKMVKLDSGTIVLEKTMENLSEMMDCVQRNFTYQAQQEEKKLIFCGDDTVTLLCDRIWLMEAVSNLVKNAFAHTKAGDTISIQWKQFASIVQLVVQDNGSGIHPEDLPHVFKRFYRSRFSKDTQGVGLGLPLTKAIVEAHSGTIEIDSDLGRGTTFTINFLIPTKL